MQKKTNLNYLLREENFRIATLLAILFSAIMAFLLLISSVSCVSLDKKPKTSVGYNIKSKDHLPCLYISSFSATVEAKIMIPILLNSLKEEIAKSSQLRFCSQRSSADLILSGLVSRYEYQAYTPSAQGLNQNGHLISETNIRLRDRKTRQIWLTANHVYQYDHFTADSTHAFYRIHKQHTDNISRRMAPKIIAAAYRFHDQQKDISSTINLDQPSLVGKEF